MDRPAGRADGSDDRTHSDRGHRLAGVTEEKHHCDDLRGKLTSPAHPAPGVVPEARVDRR